MAKREDQAVVIPVPGADWALEGIFVGGEGPEPAGALIAAPHPLYGGSMDAPVVGELAHGLARAGYATLRFNWRGVGASGGATSGEPDEADADCAAALAYLADTVSGPLLAAGYSFGAGAALRLARTSPRVRRLVLVAPPPALLDAAALEAFRGSVLALTGASDGLAPPGELAAPLGEGPRRRLEVIDDADHFFAVGLAEISGRLQSWLENAGSASARRSGS